MVSEIAKEKCTGCGACQSVCPLKCITMQPDEKGFLYPQVEIRHCVNCGKCSMVCPVENKVERKMNDVEPETWAAWSLEHNIRYESTSGGVFTELALEVLRQKGYVCGARYNEEHMVEHIMINKVSDLGKIRQSKYVQSDTKKVYIEAEEYLKKGEYVLFCGTPCECAGMYNYLGKEYDNLLCVDFVCRGSNSPKVYKLFLQSLEEKYGSKVSRVWFKNKALGWRRFSTRVEFENGEVYSEDRYTDLYIRGYIAANLYMRDSCADCQYKTMPRISDITLGDFWGIKTESVGAETDGGTSLVMLNSSKGREIFKRIQHRLFVNKRTFSEACNGNKCILESPKFNEKANIFWQDVDVMNIMDNIRRFCK